MFLKVEKIEKRKNKEVDAKHLLFLWSGWTAKQLAFCSVVALRCALLLQHGWRDLNVLYKSSI